MSGRNAGCPTSTYRLQIHDTFTLADAAEIVDYLADLGAGAVYCSPLLKSAAGSIHGYDVVDVRQIDPARGGREGWDALLAAARRRGLQLVVDIVPNHLGVADAMANHPWSDVLRLGRSSAYASWFDIDWETGRIRLPVLADDAELSRDLSVAGHELRYADLRFPLAPGTEPVGDDSAIEVHDRQHYELVNFRRADTDQNYRRFFSVTSLAGLRVEDRSVFDATHREIARWVEQDGVDGLRVDHPDGLADPGGYLGWLRQLAPDAWITVEKILEPGEQLPDWPVDGTTGYDALTEVGSVFVDPAAEAAFDTTYRALTGDERDFAAHVEVGKRLVAGGILQAEFARLGRLVPDIDRAVEALRELAVAMPVYRSYLPVGRDQFDAAVSIATRRCPELTEPIAAVLPQLGDPSTELCRRFQQTTGAVMAKGVEDTAYYRYSRFVALNEVGGDPSRFGDSLENFHAAQQWRQRSAPLAMTTVSTHDTKRDEDVRARLAVLSELPGEWASVAEKLMATARTPNRAFGYLLWQTFVGVGFIERDRMHSYAEKAMREAADGTGWIDPDDTFEAAVHADVDAGYDDEQTHELLADLIALTTAPGWSNGLGQKLVQLTMPGVPDVYQGSEIFGDSLVDPDNRRPVDFAALARMRSLASPPVDGTGAAKLWVTSHALRLRRDEPSRFASYTPLRADGVAADHLVGFDRGGAITLATRLPVGLLRSGGWRDTSVTVVGDHVDVITGRSVAGTVAVADVLADYPVALLRRLS